MESAIHDMDHGSHWRRKHTRLRRGGIGQERHDTATAHKERREFHFRCQDGGRSAAGDLVSRLPPVEPQRALWPSWEVSLPGAQRGGGGQSEEEEEHKVRPSWPACRSATHRIETPAWPLNYGRPQTCSTLRLVC